MLQALFLFTEAGGHVTDRTGIPLHFNNKEPMLNGVLAADKASSSRSNYPASLQLTHANNFADFYHQLIER